MCTVFLHRSLFALLFSPPEFEPSLELKVVVIVVFAVMIPFIFLQRKILEISKERILLAFAKIYCFLDIDIQHLIRSIIGFKSSS